MRAFGMLALLLLSPVIEVPQVDVPLEDVAAPLVDAAPVPLPAPVEAIVAPPPAPARVEPRPIRVEADAPAPAPAVEERARPAAEAPALPPIPAPQEEPVPEPVAVEVATVEAPPAPPQEESPPPAPQVEAPSAPAKPAPLGQAAAAGALLLLPLAALYARIRGASLLRQATREKLHAALAQEPGLPAAALARRVGIDPSTALYHLRRLKQEGLAVEERGGWFLAGTAARESLVAAREGAAVIEALRAAPGATKSGLAARLGVPRATLAPQLARLERAGLVECRREGRSVRVFVV